MKINVLIIAICSFSFSSFAQSEQVKVKEVVQTYFDGYAAGDTTMLKEAFHPDFHLSWINPWDKAGRPFKQVDRKGMFKFFGSNWSDLVITSSIDEIEVSEFAATAKATVTLKGIVVWTDYLSLLKINERWWIVSKISEGEIMAKE